MELLIEKTASTRHNSLFLLKGLLAVLWGIFALFAAIVPAMVLVYTFGILNIVASVLTVTYAYRNRHLKIAHEWLLLEAFVELAAGVVFTFFVHDVSHFLQYMSYGVIFVVTLQFIYGFSLLLTNVLHPKNLVARFMSLIAGSLVSVVLLANSFGVTWSFIIIGIFSIIYGILNAQFSLKLRNIILGEAE